MAIQKDDVLIRVTMEYRTKNGYRKLKILEGLQVAEWDAALDSLSTAADLHGINSDWSKFKWQEELKS